MKRVIIFCLLFFKGIILLASEETHFESIIYEIEAISFSNGAKGEELVNMLQKLTADDPNNVKKWAQYIYCKAILKNTQGINDSTLIAEISRCLAAVEERPYYYFEKTLLRYAVALTYVAKGEYAEAFTNALQALEGFQEQKDLKFVAKSLMLLGNICIYIKSYSMADDYLSKALSLTTSAQLEYYQLRLNQYTILTYTGKTQAAIDSLLSFIPTVMRYQNPGILANAYLNIGGFYSIIEENEKAFHFLSLVENMLNLFDNRRIYMTLYQNLGFYHLKFYDYKQAYYYFQKSTAIAIKNQNLSQLFHASRGLHALYDQSGNTDSAYYYLKRCYTLRNQLLNNSKTIESYQAYVSVLIESAEKELRIAVQEISIKNKRLTVVIISAIGLLLLAGLLIIVIQQKKKLKDAENRDLAERLQYDVEIQKLQEEKIASQVREIASFSLMMSNKNYVLKQIADVSKQQPSNYDEAIENNKKINRIIKNNFNTDSDWNAFMLHFDKVHPHFFNKLKSLCADLTENNLRLCAYFRIGLSSKQIARILNIMPEAVRKIRFRLKKKFNLREEEDFNDFIRNI